MRLIGSYRGDFHSTRTPEVVEIQVEGRQVKELRLKDGSLHLADIILSNGDVAYTYRNLISAYAR